MIQESIRGKPVRIVSINKTESCAHARYPDGTVAKIDILNGDFPEPGEIMLLSEKYWERAPKDTWPASNSVGVVTEILKNEYLLIDDGYVIKKILPSTIDQINIGTTVEFNEIDGVVGILSEDPIFSRARQLSPHNAAKEYLVESPATSLSFDDFGGYPDVISRARELIETQLKKSDKLLNIGARPVKGILFSGPPGTGKTHLARIISHQSNADFYQVSGPEIVSKWVGDTEDTLRKIFQAATTSEKGKSIIFFDEIDSIAERRSGDSHEASKRLVAQLLTLMDGFDDKQRSVIVIAATNRVESLDPALTRPGRFDWEIEFGMPSSDDRLAILRVGARKLRTSGVLPLEDVAALTRDWTAAELSAIWTEAALVAAGDTRDTICAEDVAQAYERINSRPKRKKSTSVVL